MILDRRLRHATTLNIKGESYRRLNEKKRAWLIGRKPQAEGNEVAAKRRAKSFR